MTNRMEGSMRTHTHTSIMSCILQAEEKGDTLQQLPSLRNFDPEDLAQGTGGYGGRGAQLS